MLQATPTIVGFKEQWPAAKVTVLIEKQFAFICEGIPGIDEVVEIDLSYVCRCLWAEREGIVDAYRYLDEMVAELRSRHFDFCLNMSSSGYTALLLKMLDIPDCRGWISDDEGHRIISSPWAMLFSAFVYHSNREYNSLNLVDIFRCASGVTKHPTRLVYNVSEDGRAFAERYLADNFAGDAGLGRPGGRPLVCIQAGASQGKRQWSAARFAFVARELIDQLGARIVFTGSSSELPIIESITRLIERDGVVVAAGKTKVSELAGLLERANVLITGDTGPMHLSVAVGTPVVALFLASALCFETGPYSEGNIVLQPQISCNPCNPNFPCSRPDCHDQIAPELVVHMTKVRLREKDLSLVGKVDLPDRYCDPTQVAVFVTTFDKDRFLEFRQVNGVSPRHGRSGEYFRTAREAYRELWKNEFLPSDAVKAVQLPETVPAAALQGVAETIELTKAGTGLINQLLEVILDNSKPARLLSEISQKIQAVDKSIEEVGLGSPILGALTRIFVMEKENMRGDNPELLASEMRELYRRLANRTTRFDRLFGYHSLPAAAGGVEAARTVERRG